MTIEETRHLGIEFERRVQTMIPEKEFVDKLDTETIYSFLNQYQDKYIHEIYRSLDQIPSGSRLSAHVESVLQSLLAQQTVKIEDATEDATTDISALGDVIVDTARSVTYPLPTNFYMYIRSVSQVSKTFSFKAGTGATAQLPIRVISNQLVSQTDVWKLIETPHDSLRILRHPAAVLNIYDGENPTITVIYDRYTTPTGIKIIYYKQPQQFSLMTSTPCELPMDAFDDIVSGAVDLYVQYVAGAVANKERQDNARRQQAEEARKRRNNNDEQ